MQEYIKKVVGSGNHPSSFISHNTILIISNDKMKDIIEIVKSLEDSELLLKQFKMKLKNKEEDFLVRY